MESLAEKRLREEMDASAPSPASSAPLRERGREPVVPTTYPRVGHVLQFGFRYTPTALQAASQLQLSLDAAGVTQSVYSNRPSMDGVAAPAPEDGPPPGAWSRWRRIWSANFSIYAQNPRWRDQDTLIVYHPAHFPAVNAHRRIVFVCSGEHWVDRPRGLHQNFRRFLNQLAYRRSARVVATETRWLRAFGFEAQPGEFLHRAVRPSVWHIPPFVDTAIFNPEAADPRLTPMNAIVCLGPISRSSGFDLLIEAFQRFASRQPDAMLWIAGSPERGGQLARLLEPMRRAGLAGRAMYLGQQPEAALPEILASARIAVFPGGGGDLKIAALQAMACGAPTLSTSAGGLDEVPTRKFEPTPEGLLQEMELAWSEGETIGLRQSQQVRAQYSLERWESAWLDLLRQSQL